MMMVSSTSKLIILTGKHPRFPTCAESERERERESSIEYKESLKRPMYCSPSKVNNEPFCVFSSDLDNWNAYIIAYSITYATLKRISNYVSWQIRADTNPAFLKRYLQVTDCASKLKHKYDKNHMYNRIPPV